MLWKNLIKLKKVPKLQKRKIKKIKIKNLDNKNQPRKQGLQVRQNKKFLNSLRPNKIQTLLQKLSNKEI